MSLVHVSLFSGVGGIDLAMADAGIPTRAVCEIDPAARGVLADRFPDAHLYTDVKDVTGAALTALDLDPARTVVSAGFPCQDLSVAGRRRGMGEGTRSGLYWQVDRILGEFAPAWVVLENVPGLLSAACPCPGDGLCVERGLAVRCDADLHAVTGGSCWGECIARHGGVMGAVLGSLAQRGYGFAYRVLDAQHFGVPQRRRRVVVVGRLGDDGRAPAQVLLEPEGLHGDPAAGITPRPVFAPDPRPRAGAGGLARALTAEGHDASEDGTGRGTPIVATPLAVRGRDGGAQLEVGPRGGPCNALRAGDGGSSRQTLVMIETPIVAAPTIAATLTAGTSGAGASAPGRRQEDDHNIVAFAGQTGGNVDMPIGPVAPTLGTRQVHSVAYAADITTALDTAQGGPDDNSAQGGHLVATFQKVIRSGARDAAGDLPPEVWAERKIAATLNLNDLGPGLTVRRLTPIECERLQGFPDGHTSTSNGKPQADSPRYKQMGNSVAIPVFAWVAHRLAAVDAAQVAA